MPKRGSSTSGTVSVVPRKKQKNDETNNDADPVEHDENTPMNGSYSSQLFTKTPEVAILSHRSPEPAIDRCALAP
jgi:hypothetical protein